jgi:hypothetical protein
MAMKHAALHLAGKPTEPTIGGAKRALTLLRMPAGRGLADSLRGTTEARTERRCAQATATQMRLEGRSREPTTRRLTPR